MISSYHSLFPTSGNTTAAKKLRKGGFPVQWGREPSDTGHQKGQGMLCLFDFLFFLNC